MKLVSASKSAINFRRSDVKKVLGASTPLAVREAYNSLRTSLLFLNRGEKCPVYAVTSALTGEGKTLNCINIAVSFANMGKRVLLIDADMRNPTLYKYFGTPMQNGLSEYLAGIRDDADIRTLEIARLSILTSGKLPPNPAELLSGQGMDILLQKERERFDYIFIDTPPVSAVTDAAVLAEKVTGYVFVARRGKTDVRAVRQSLAILEQVSATIAGFLLNDAATRSKRREKYFGDYA